MKRKIVKRFTPLEDKPSIRYRKLRGKRRLVEIKKEGNLEKIKMVRKRR